MDVLVAVFLVALFVAVREATVLFVVLFDCLVATFVASERADVFESRTDAALI